MTRQVITVKMDDSLEAVARLMTERRISGFPVVWPDGRIVGVISEGDLLRRFRSVQVPSFLSILGGLFPVGSLEVLEREIREIAALKVSEVMSRPAITASPDWTVERAAGVMIEKQINRLPVTDAEGRVVGIVTRADLVRQMAGSAGGA